MLGRKHWQTVAKVLVTVVSIAIVIMIGGGVDDAHAAFWERSRTADTPQTTIKTTGKIAEASPPLVLQELRQALDDYEPQVTILSPRKNEVLSDSTVSVRFLVKDLPIFKNETFGLGPHLHVLLDNHSYQAVYDTSQPLVFNDLEPGTHTIRAFASRPWHESFKNDGAFVQTTFHVFTRTQDNSPNPDLPLLTYSRPQGIYGAEPILLDFYLTNAPLHLVAQADETDDLADWRIRCTVNGNSFVIDRWQPLYLKGFKPGKNWVQLEYLDDKGNPVPNVFNNTVRIVEYQPNGNDTLSKLVRGELSAADLHGIVDPNYMPPAPIVEPVPEPSASPLETPSPEPPSSPEPIPSLDVLERSDSITPPLPSPEPSPTPNVEPTPEVVVPSPAPASPEPSSTPLEMIVPTLPTTPTKEQEAIAPPVPSSEPSSALKPEPTSPIQPTVPEDTNPATAPSVGGKERLQQLKQRLNHYLPQSKAIAPSSRMVPSTEPNQRPVVSSPTPLPTTPPEIIDTTPPEAPSTTSPAP